MLTDDDKKWIAAELSGQVAASEGRMEALTGFEARMGTQLDRFEARLIAEFQKWTLPLIDSRVEAAARRTMDLEVEPYDGPVSPGFMQDVEKLLCRERRQTKLAQLIQLVLRVESSFARKRVDHASPHSRSVPAL